MIMKNLIFKILIIIIFFSCSLGKAQTTYNYTFIPNDPYQARIYKLDNGLMVYFSVYKDAPKIQCEVVVRTGSKNDPPDNTGLSHYLEHLMFKGTDKFGTTDFTKEKPLLDEIERLFETHKFEKNPLKRRFIYRQIDRISMIASKYAIPNEYDKLMALLRSVGTNNFIQDEFC